MVLALPPAKRWVVAGQGRKKTQLDSADGIRTQDFRERERERDGGEREGEREGGGGEVR